jgi:membrane-associated phospholipid phosphatase
VRNAFLISGAIGLVCFALFPVAPPRLLDEGWVDTVTERSEAYRVLQPPVFVNQYAAMPSLHVGWDLLIGISLVRLARRRTVKALGVVLPAAMFLATVLTANHYIIDGAAGAALALGALWAAYRLRTWSYGRHLRDARGRVEGSADASG